MIVGANEQIGCTPPEITGVVAAVKGAFATVGNKHLLVRLGVVFGDATYKAGTTVYVRYDQQALEWYKAVYELNGTKFIIVPTSSIRLRSE